MKIVTGVLTVLWWKERAIRGVNSEASSGNSAIDSQREIFRETIDKVNDIEFWFYVLLGHREYIISQGYGGGQPNISQDLIKGLRFPSPIDLNEQKKIARLLNEKLMNHNKLTKKEINRLQLLNEYRKSLISNVVSGNIKI